MKVKRTHEYKTFEPITIEITLETVDEAAAMHNLFNCIPVSAVLQLYGISENDTNNIRNSIAEQHTNLYHEISRAFTEFYKDFKKQRW